MPGADADTLRGPIGCSFHCTVGRPQFGTDGAAFFGTFESTVVITNDDAQRFAVDGETPVTRGVDGLAAVAISM